MQEINVFITGGKIQVSDDPVAIHSGQPVVWHFHNCETDTVTWAEVVFGDAKASMFKDRGAAGTGGVPSVSRGADVGKGNGLVMGTAPELGVPAGRPGVAQAFKYDVKAYDKNPRFGGVEKYKLDPQIIVEDP
ncbi:MAG TPA: hypothetical protein VGK89_10945 [Candidatus Eisenbacteria bacterium]|jgi:hypothetical protein